MKDMNFVASLLKKLCIDEDVVDIFQFSLIMMEKDECELPDGFITKNKDGESLYCLTHDSFYKPATNQIIDFNKDVIVDDVSFNTDGVPKAFNIKSVLNTPPDEVAQIDALLVSSLILREYTIEITQYHAKEEPEQSQDFDFGAGDDLMEALRVSRPIDVSDYIKAVTEVLGWDVAEVPLNDNEFPHISILSHDHISGYISPICPSMGDNTDKQFNEMLDLLGEHSLGIGEDCLLLCGASSGVTFSDHGEAVENEKYLYPYGVYFSEDDNEWSWLCFNELTLKEQVGVLPVFGDKFEKSLEKLPESFYGEQSVMLKYSELASKKSTEFLEKNMPVMPGL